MSKHKKVTLKGKPIGSEARQIWLAFQDAPRHRKAAIVHAWKERLNNG